MGKKWDATGVSFDPETWRAVLRVCKPGAMLLAFGGTRTYHRMACAIEDAGWEIRDCVQYAHDGSAAHSAFLESLNPEQLGAYLNLHYPNGQLEWIYGSGFPKSADISKMLDKAAGVEREVIREHPHIAQYHLQGQMAGQDKTIYQGGINGAANGGRMLTAPATDLAKRWSGFGTSLKPAHEPIVLAMKPVDGTFAANAEKWGVAGLNIDGCRVPTNGEEVTAGLSNPANRKGVVGTDLGISNNDIGAFQEAQRQSLERTNALGRWPANLILDDSEQVKRLFPDSQSGALTAAQQVNGGFKGAKNCYGSAEHGGSGEYAANSGSAARFFQACESGEATSLRYCAKAASSERRLDERESILVECWVKGDSQWENADHKVLLLVDTEQFPPRAIDVSGTPNSNASEWNTTLFGSSTTDQSLLATSSIIERRTASSTTGSRTCNWLRHSTTREFILDANCETESGGSHAESAATGILCLITTSARMASLLGAENVALPMRLRISASEWRSNHPTVKPLSLMQYLCRLVCPPGGIILDPFGGSFTTVVAAWKENRACWSIESHRPYFEIGRARVKSETGRYPLFGDE